MLNRLIKQIKNNVFKQHLCQSGLETYKFNPKLLTNNIISLIGCGYKYFLREIIYVNKKFI